MVRWVMEVGRILLSVSPSLLVAFSFASAQMPPTLNRPCTPAQIATNDFLAAYVATPGQWLYQSNTFTVPHILSSDDAQFALELQSTLSKRGIELILLPIPSKPVVAATEASFDPTNARAQYLSDVASLRRRGLVVIDALTPALDNYVDPTTGLKFYARTDSHWTTYGAKLTAKAVSKRIRSSLQYPQLPKTTYDITEAAITRVGNLAAQMNQLCETHFGPESEFSYTFKKRGESSELLSSDSIPIALAGTSYSSEKYMHFADFIAEATRLDVVNYSESGGQKFAALLRFLQSDSLKNDPPHFLIWEFPNSYETLSADQLKQLRDALRQSNQPVH
ncbi:alginate O-acetyltransferase AlgX-related protein [Deinococcus sp. UYEF24]